MEPKKLVENDNETEIKIEIMDDSDTNDVGLDIKPELTLEPEPPNFVFCAPNTPINSFKPDSIREVVESYKITHNQDSGKVACHICGKLYEQRHLRYHINKHNGLKPFECKETNCTLKFAAPYELKAHVKQHHIKIATTTTFFCDICEKGFTQKGTLKRHKISHGDPELSCIVCKKLFKYPISLKKHMLVHSQERKFPCEICKKSFQTNYTLRIHQRVHTQEKPYSCNCGVAFAYKCLLKTHTEKCKQTSGSS